MSKKNIRVLIAKLGLDGHDRGAKVVARGLRDAGYEVLYTGLHQTPESVVHTALQEDVDLIGISILSGAHLSLIEVLSNCLKKQNLMIPVFVGGIVPAEDIPALKVLGVKEVFGPGTPLQTIVESIGKIV